jgi:hypothetical protein
VRDARLMKHCVWWVGLRRLRAARQLVQNQLRRRAQGETPPCAHLSQPLRWFANTAQLRCAPMPSDRVHDSRGLSGAEGRRMMGAGLGGAKGSGQHAVQGGQIPPGPRQVSQGTRLAGAWVGRAAQPTPAQARTASDHTAMKKLRIVTRVGGRSRGRYATPADFPRHDGTSYRGLRVRRWGLGSVHSRAILCRAVPNP